MFLHSAYLLNSTWLFKEVSMESEEVTGVGYCYTFVNKVVKITSCEVFLGPDGNFLNERCKMRNSARVGKDVKCVCNSTITHPAGESKRERETTSRRKKYLRYKSA